jgi:predicted  nucleic acid-binding Zn-ribbon protein
VFKDFMLNVAYRVEKKFQAAEESGIQVRNAGIEALAALKNRLEMLSEDHSAQRKLNTTIADLREANVMLKEKLQSRNAEFSGMERQCKDVKQELQECRAQLTATTDDLGKAIAASREDALLRTQLQDLQTSYSIAKAQAESSASETERVTADLHEQEKLTMLAQEEASKLQDKLRQSEAKVSAFDTQKKAHTRQLKDESNMQRLQMERDIQARLAEDETRHNGNISSLRRQVAEANNNLCQMKGKLQDMENMSSNKEAETNRLAAQVLAVTTELGTLRDEACLMEQNQNRRGSELRTSQQQLIQCMDKAAEWSTRAEENALEFAKRCKEVADGFQKSEQVAEAEVDRLGALVLMLQKKNDDSDIKNSSVARYLRSRGLLKAGLTLTEWAVQPNVKNFRQEETNLGPSHPSVIGELRNILAVNPESNAHGSHEDVRTSAVSHTNKQIPVDVLDNTSTNLMGEYISHAANPSSALIDEGRRKTLSENDGSLLTSYSMPASKSIIRDISKHENHLGTRFVELTSASTDLSNGSQIFLATEATPLSYLQASDDLDTSNIRLSGTKKLEGTARTVTPDSQEEMMQEQIPAFMRPIRRVAERRHSTPHLREAERTVTRTEFTEYSMRTSEMYDNTPTLQCNGKGGVRFSDSATKPKSVNSDVDSSGLSEPPDNMENIDFTEYLGDSDGNDRKDPYILRMSNKNAYAQSVASHPAPSPKPNSSRVRTRARVQKKEIKQPKSILKRTDTAIRNDTPTDIHSNGKPLEITQPSKVQNIRRCGPSKGRLPGRSSGPNGIEGATYGSSYNRIVSGSRSTQDSSYFQASNAPLQVQGTSTADVFAISSSPAIGQPQRNSKKRALSGAGFSDRSRPAKLQRSARHQS